MSPIALVERLLQLVPVLLGISVIVFFLMALTPGDPVELMLGDARSTAEQRESMRRDMGLDRPVHERFLRFLASAAQGEFGMSYQHRRPVAQVIRERIPATIELTLAAMVIALAVGIGLGVLAAVKRDGWIDRLATVSSLVGMSMPPFWLGILLILLCAVTLGILPASGRIGYAAEVPFRTGFLTVDALLAGRLDSFLDALRHLFLPALTLGLTIAALLMRVTRTAMIEALAQDYVTFAEAKGISRARVLFRHALKNALIPVVTVAAIETGTLLGGNMIVETVFGWPGLGRLVVDGIFTRNYPLVQAGVLIYAVTYVFLNLAADLLYGALNPRVRL